jgi:hypothetical protein
MSHATCPYRHPRESKGPAKAALCLAAQGSRFRGKDTFQLGRRAAANSRDHMLPAIHRMIVPVIRPRPADQERHKGAYVLNIHQLLLGCSSATAHFVEVNDAAKHLAPLRIIRLRLPLPLASA